MVEEEKKNEEHNFAQWKKKLEWNPTTNNHQQLTINKIHEPRTTIHRPVTTNHQQKPQTHQQNNSINIGIDINTQTQNFVTIRHQ